MHYSSFCRVYSMKIWHFCRVCSIKIKNLSGITVVEKTINKGIRTSKGGSLSCWRTRFFIIARQSMQFLLEIARQTMQSYSFIFNATSKEWSLCSYVWFSFIGGKTLRQSYSYMTLRQKILVILHSISVSFFNRQSLKSLIWG